MRVCGVVHVRLWCVCACVRCVHGVCVGCVLRGVSGEWCVCCGVRAVVCVVCAVCARFVTFAAWRIFARLAKRRQVHNKFAARRTNDSPCEIKNKYSLAR